MPAGTPRGGDGLRLRCSPRIDGEAPVVMLICWRSRVGVVSGVGDFTRRLPGVTEDGATVNGDDFEDWLGDRRDGGDDGKRPRDAGPAGKGWFPNGGSSEWVCILGIWYKPSSIVRYWSRHS